MPQLEGIATLSGERAPSAPGSDSLQILVQLEHPGSAVTSHWRCSRSSRCPAHSARLMGARRQCLLGERLAAVDIEWLAEQSLRDALRAAAPPCGSPSPDPSAGRRPAPDWVASLQHQTIACRADFQRGIVERALRERRREPRRHQKHVAFTQGNLQSLGQLQHPSPGATAPRGRFPQSLKWRAEIRRRQIELTEVTALALFTQVVADMDGFGAVCLRRIHVRSWSKTYHADFTHSITSKVIETGQRLDHLRKHRR